MLSRDSSPPHPICCANRPLPGGERETGPADAEEVWGMNKPVLPMSSLSLKLPAADRSIETYRLAASRTFPARLEGTLNRVAFSAAHVVADPLADGDPWLNAAIDWDRTIAFREHVWDLGL